MPRVARDRRDRAVAPGVAAFLAAVIVGEDIAATGRRGSCLSTSGLEVLFAGDPPLSRLKPSSSGDCQRPNGVQFSAPHRSSRVFSRCVQGSTQELASLRTHDGVDPQGVGEAGLAGQGESFDRWYAGEHRRVLASLVAVVGDLDEAREVTDHAFAKALERWDRVCLMESPTAWTYTVALNHARTRGRRRSRERRLWEQGATEVVSRTEGLSVEVWDAVGRLPRRQREAVALRYLADLGDREIAEVMGVTMGTVASTLHDARARLAQTLGAASTTQEVPR